MENIKSMDNQLFRIPCYDYCLYAINEKKSIMSFMNSCDTIEDLFFEQNIYALFYIKNDACIAYALDREKELVDISKTGDGSVS